MNILFIGNGFDLEHKVNIRFQDFVNSLEFKKHMKRYLKFFESEKYNQLFPMTDLWSEFENFCLEITNSEKIKKSVFYRKISSCFSLWITSQKPKPVQSEVVKNVIKKHNIFAIISLNFTDTPAIYGFKSKTFDYNDDLSEWQDITKWKKKFIKIHYFPRKLSGNFCIIGSDQEKIINKNSLISYWGKDKKIFNHKDKVLKTIEKNSCNLYFYGFSFGKSDINLYKWAVGQKNVTIYCKEKKLRIKTKKFHYIHI